MLLLCDLLLKVNLDLMITYYSAFVNLLPVSYLRVV